MIVLSRTCDGDIRIGVVMKMNRDSETRNIMRRGRMRKKRQADKRIDFFVNL